MELESAAVTNVTYIHRIKDWKTIYERCTSSYRVHSTHRSRPLPAILELRECSNSVRIDNCQPTRPLVRGSHLAEEHVKTASENQHQCHFIATFG